MPLMLWLRMDLVPENLSAMWWFWRMEIGGKQKGSRLPCIKRTQKRRLRGRYSPQYDRQAEMGCKKQRIAFILSSLCGPVVAMVKRRATGFLFWPKANLNGCIPVIGSALVLIVPCVLPVHPGNHFDQMYRAASCVCSRRP